MWVTINTGGHNTTDWQTLVPMKKMPRNSRVATYSAATKYRDEVAWTGGTHHSARPSQLCGQIFKCMWVDRQDSKPALHTPVSAMPVSTSVSYYKSFFLSFFCPSHSCSSCDLIFISEYAVGQYKCWLVQSNICFPGGTPMLDSMNRNKNTVYTG